MTGSRDPEPMETRRKETHWSAGWRGFDQAEEPTCYEHVMKNEKHFYWMAISIILSTVKNYYLH